MVSQKVYEADASPQVLQVVYVSTTKLASEIELCSNWHSQTNLKSKFLF